MRKTFAGFVVAVFVVALGVPAFAKTETVTGKVIDVSCYKLDKTNASNDHKMPHGDMKDCAVACAKMGQPMALLTTDGKVYQLAGGLAADKNAKIIAHIAHTVEVTGDVTEKDGTMLLAADSLKMISK
jgi:hypothetical protein